MKLIVRALFAALLLAVHAAAQSSIPKVRVQFAKGTSNKAVKGQIKGYQTIDYVVRADAGQTMKVTLQTSNDASYFNVIPPGETDVAMFIGSTSGNAYEGTLPSSGDYAIRVYMMRSAARRNETANYTLNISITGKAQSSNLNTPPATYNASGKVKCSAGKASLDAWCDFKVVRRQGGATIWIAKPAGAEQAGYPMLEFDKNAFTTNDGGRVQWERQSDNWSVGINGREFYFIPDALIYGG